MRKHAVLFSPSGNPHADAWRLRSGKHDIHIAPIVGCRSALVGPIWRIVQVIGYLGRPATPQVAVEQVALHWLTKPSSTARDVNLPAGRKVQSATHGMVDLSLFLGVLQRVYVPRPGNHGIFHLARLTVHRSHGIHERFSPLS